MSFLDELRKARSSRVAVLHEFWTQYNPSKARLHLFFEAQDDATFFVHHLRPYLADDTRVYTYHCDGKSQVYQAFEGITQHDPGVRAVLFFVDKDLDDILGVPWPTDPRVFVTDVYSIENYLVSGEVLQSFYRDAVRLRGVAFDIEAILRHFGEQLARFHRAMASTMAWVIVARRAGHKVNLSNIRLKDLFEMDADVHVRCRPGLRLDSLCSSSGVPPRGAMYRQLLPLTRELRKMNPKRVIRGKFEAWFLVEFWKGVINNVQQLAGETGGTVSVKLPLEHSNAVATLAKHATTPRSLELFLQAHFPRAPLGPPRPPASGSRRWAVFGRILETVRLAIR